MKYDKKIVIVGIIVLVILSVFLTIKYNCEKLHQDILMYGDKDVSAVYLVNSKIRKDNLYLDIIGPISKGNVFIDSDINIEIKDNLGTTIGKSLIKDSEIFNTSGKHITFSAMIPNITWKDRLAGIKIDMFLSRKYTDKYCINNDMSNIKLYYKGEKIKKDNCNTTKLNLYQMLFGRAWIRYRLYEQGRDEYGLYRAFTLLKSNKVKNRSQLENVLSKQGLRDYEDYFKFDAHNNIKIYIDDIEVSPSNIKGETGLTTTKNGSIINDVKQTVKGWLRPEPKKVQRDDYFDKL